VDASIGLLGPIFIPFLVFDKLDWLFWGWLKAYLGFSFYKVVAAATMNVLSHVLTNYYIQLGQSLSERIQFTAPDKSLGVANRDLGVIKASHPDGRLTAGLSDDRQVDFNAREHPHFDHGYAVTSHSSQGLTAERVLVHADTSVHPDLLNSRFTYVSVSRASHDVVVFKDDVAKLVPQLGTDISKTTALEMN
jgi:ATP-dependent exoDNAse (exonuclease V) alpha subunit